MMQPLVGGPHAHARREWSSSVGCDVQAATDEVVAASMVYSSNVDVDRPMSEAVWKTSHALPANRMHDIKQPLWVTPVRMPDKAQLNRRL